MNDGQTNIEWWAYQYNNYNNNGLFVHVSAFYKITSMSYFILMRLKSALYILARGHKS